MIFHPPVLALLLASALSSGLAVWASLFAVKLLRRWDLASGAEAQLWLERQTYLVSTVLAFVMVVELASLVLFVFNADRMAPMFVGAMCAVGVLNASVYGFPALLAKIAVFFAASLWLAVNHADGKGRDYPLIRIKYRLLLGVAPLVLLAAGLQLAYFLDIKADTITSCCGKMFTPDKSGLAGEMAGLGEWTALWLLYGGLAATAAAGLWARLSGGAEATGNEADVAHAPQAAASTVRARLLARTGEILRAWRGAPKPGMIAYGAVSVVFFAIALAAIISVISLYIYEHPHHHCPFCLLKREYNHFGFFLYAPLFMGAALGLSVGFLGAVRGAASLEAVLPTLLRRFITVSMVSFGLFGALTVWAVASSKLVLFG